MASEKECQQSVVERYLAQEEKKAEQEFVLKLKKSSQFRFVYNYGKKKLFRDFIVFYKEDLFVNEIKLGITVTKKIGCAVTRNRIKRRLKAAFNEVFGATCLNIGVDIVIVAKKTSIEPLFSTLIDNLTAIKNQLIQRSEQIA